MGVSLQVLPCITVLASLGQAVLTMAADIQYPCNLALCPMGTADLVEMTCKCMALSMGCITPQKQVHLQPSVLSCLAFASCKAMLVILLPVMHFVCNSVCQSLQLVWICVCSISVCVLHFHAGMFGRLLLASMQPLLQSVWCCHPCSCVKQLCARRNASYTASR